ncbi:hypothetical protein AAFF_G00260560 [Aldrovandia affinis]|uniref:Uncharacterized protein n=1 Tax=Aldrovandia affinis TaxID=143900 RepID=A0AAD7RC76_9TELE|nr:hypothetical protein AAFF_G00260560 [Aldrovandia affinis]
MRPVKSKGTHILKAQDDSRLLKSRKENGVTRTPRGSGHLVRSVWPLGVKTGRVRRASWNSSHVSLATCH